MLDPRNPGPDYTLRWPPELFVREAQYFADQPHVAGWADRVGLLLQEAFVGSTPFDEHQQMVNLSGPVSKGADAIIQIPLKKSLTQLIAVAPRMPQEALPRPYYSSRTRTGTAMKSPDLAGAQRSWAVAVRGFYARGYFARVAPPECVDDESIDDPVVVLNDAIEHRIGSAPDREGYWPLEPQSWTDAEFYDLVEVVHDLVSRPRYGTYHSYSNCGWHYSEFAVDPAQILYRWTANRIFERCGLPLRLAKSGEDTGRLVQVAGDDRDRLAEMVMEHTIGANADPVDHAIALYRSRDSGREAKRSACVALFGVLESHRDLLKDTLTSKDEGALFEIANRFQIRHRRADQHGEYDDAYLDWIFWWTLATVELTNQLLQRQDMAP